MYVCILFPVKKDLIVAGFVGAGLAKGIPDSVVETKSNNIYFDGLVKHTRLRRRN